MVAQRACSLRRSPLLVLRCLEHAHVCFAWQAVVGACVRFLLAGPSNQLRSNPSTRVASRDEGAPGASCSAHTAAASTHPTSASFASRCTPFEKTALDH